VTGGFSRRTELHGVSYKKIDIATGLEASMEEGEE
jgi:hypothetical protein